MKKIFTLLTILTFTININAQNNEPAGPTLMTSSTSMIHVTSIASRPNDQIPMDMTLREAKDKRSLGNKVVIGKDPQTENDFLSSNPNYLTQKIPGKTPSNVFDAYTSRSIPTDPSLAIGPNHVFVVFNTGFRIFDKDGNPLTDQISPNPAIFPSGGCCDLTASYDAAVDRWVITFLGAGGAQIAVSDGPDPINDGWNVYNIATISDYQKLSVWSDGYYLTDNTSGTNKIFAMERDKMLAGDPTAQVIGFPLPGILTDGVFFSPQAFNVSNNNMPAVGGAPFVYFQDDAWDGVSQDHIKLWTVDVDWATPGNSTISAAQIINTTPFIAVFDGGNFSNLEQPSGAGGDLDALQSTIMNQAQFRKFNDHNSAIFNFVIDTDATDDGELAAIRWYEFRQDDDNMPWSLYQEGTHSAPDGRHAWNASMIMDIQGNIGMGYTSMSGPTTPTDVRVSSYYTGRYANDPLGTMTITEELIASGENIPSTRYGDYSKIDVDPTNDKTFWFINEYFNSGSRKGVVGVFQIAPNLNDDIGVVSIDSPVTGTLTAVEDVTVTIFNFGENAASNFPVTYQVDGGTVVSEMFTGTIASATTAQFTFSATADLSTVGQTYTIVSGTNMSGDEDTTNDETTADVTHLEPNDIGVTAITNPTSGTDLTATEDIIVTITNFGGASQSNFDVSYDLDGTVVNETVAGPLEGDTEMSYTFTQTGDFSAFGSYTLMATTALSGDSDTSNDAITATITKTNCEPQSNCATGDGFRSFQVSNIDNDSGCGDGGYSDFTSITGNFEEDTTYDLTVTTEYGTQFVRVWIDFNDDFVYTNDELVVDNYLIADGQPAGSYTETMDFVVPAGVANGLHLMRAKTRWDIPVTDDACEDSAYGETEDYMASISTAAGVDDTIFGSAELIVSNLDNNQYKFSIATTEITERLTFSVTNIVGQKLISYNLDNVNGSYTYDLDMSYASPGVYIARLGNSKSGKVKKIIVK